MFKHSEMTEKREDISRFMTHFTRDTRKDGGMTARENFLSILSSGTIEARSAHCLHAKKVPWLYQKHFKVSCFTETPLDQLHHLIAFNPKRKIQLEAYGFVFSREFLIENKAHKVIPCCEYTDREQREVYDKQFKIGLANKFKNVTWRNLPFVSAMHAGYDFGWEREWRIRGDLDFTAYDLKYVVLPDADDKTITNTLALRGIPYFCPGWTFEELAERVGEQQRRTMSLYKLSSPFMRRAIVKTFEHETSTESE